jgi:hypothetical protein
MMKKGRGDVNKQRRRKEAMALRFSHYKKGPKERETCV